MCISTSSLTSCFTFFFQLLHFSSPSSSLSFFHYDFISLTTLLSEPSGRFLQHFNQALKITTFSFIHTGFAIMQPLCTGRLEVNPLSHHYPYKLLSDSSAPKTQRQKRFSISTSFFIGKNRHECL